MAVLGSVALALSEPRVLAQDSEDLYTKKCANCHAKDSSGHTAVASNFARSASRASDADTYNSIAHGTQHKEYPHAFVHTGLTEEQIQGQSMKRLRVISYLKIICRKHSRKSRESCLIHFLTRKNETSGQLRNIRRSIKGDFENWRYEFANCTSSLACGRLDLGGPETYRQ